MAQIPQPFRNYKLGPPRKDARQKVLAQWRGIDTAPLEKAQAMRARKASELLPKVLKEMRLDNRRSDAEIVKVWNNSIDPMIVAHAQPTGLNKGTLFVSVDSSVWLNEIVRYRRKEILDRLQHSFGRDFITKISFRVG
jgi:predicted nucleic acid-binding Zn ribbon protein